MKKAARKAAQIVVNRTLSSVRTFLTLLLNANSINYSFYIRLCYLRVLCYKIFVLRIIDVAHLKLIQRILIWDETICQVKAIQQ